jgi:hypothetical protein
VKSSHDCAYDIQAVLSVSWAQVVTYVGQPYMNPGDPDRRRQPTQSVVRHELTWHTLLLELQYLHHHARLSHAGTIASHGACGVSKLWQKQLLGRN